MEKSRVLVTGVGSLPHQDVEAALELVFRYCPQIPFWPQLPKRDIREGMVAQFSENLPCLRGGKDGMVFSHQDKEKKLEAFYERIIANDIDYFKISPEYALGLHKFYQRLEKIDLKPIEFIKCQACGPFTFAASIKDENGVVLLHDNVFMQAVIKGLSVKALWQIKLFRKFGKKLIIFFDEPYLGCFGSAYTPINRETVIKGLSELTEGIKSADVLVGVHCCGNTDWSLFSEVPGIDMISFDAFAFLDRLVLYADDLKTFFKRKGKLCWGIIPTQEFSGQETAELLIGKIKQGIDALAAKGADRDSLRHNLILSPACGLGTLDPAKSEKIFSLLSEVKNKLFDKLS